EEQRMPDAATPVEPPLAEKAPEPKVAPKTQAPITAPAPQGGGREEWQKAFAHLGEAFSLRAGSAPEGRLGVRLSRPTADLADQWSLRRGGGLCVDQVIPASPAARAGLSPHDILLTLDDRPVPSDPRSFAWMVDEFKPDVPLSLVVLRRGKKETITGL